MSWEIDFTLFREINFAMVCLVRSVHKFDSKLINGTPNVWRPVESDRDIFLKGSKCLLCKGHTVGTKVLFLSNDQFLLHICNISAIY
jgi:hypothetical protein